jgi:hypothetical protein
VGWIDPWMHCLKAACHGRGSLPNPHGSVTAPPQHGDCQRCVAQLRRPAELAVPACLPPACRRLPACMQIACSKACKSWTWRRRRCCCCSQRTTEVLAASWGQCHARHRDDWLAGCAAWRRRCQAEAAHARHVPLPLASMPAPCCSAACALVARSVPCSKNEHCKPLHPKMAARGKLPNRCSWCLGGSSTRKQGGSSFAQNRYCYHAFQLSSIASHPQAATAAANMSEKPQGMATEGECWRLDGVSRQWRPAPPRLTALRNMTATSTDLGLALLQAGQPTATVPCGARQRWRRCRWRQQCN